MGLDIYFHKTTIAFKGDPTNNDDLSAFTNEVDELAKKTLRKRFEKAIKPLEKAWSRVHYTDNESGEVRTNDYALKEYKHLYFQFVVKELDPTIGRNYDWKVEPYTSQILPFPDLKAKLDKEVEGWWEQYDAYFRKVNFLFKYFEDRHKMYDQWFAFVTKEDVDDIIDKCKRILATKEQQVAHNLLPTQNGFFFGSTEYDEYYYYDVKDCLKQMKKYRKLLKEGVTGYIIFSW